MDKIAKTVIFVHFFVKILTKIQSNLVTLPCYTCFWDNNKLKIKFNYGYITKVT